MIRAGFLYAFAVAGLSLHSAAQELETPLETVPEPALITSVSLDDLQTLVETAGHQIDAIGSAGDVSVRGLTAEGMRYLLIGAACTEPSVEEAVSTCSGINMQVRYNAGSVVGYDKINEVNINRAAVNVWLSMAAEETQPNTLGVARYIILDGGQTQDNLIENLNVLLVLAPMVADELWPPSEDAEADQEAGLETETGAPGDEALATLDPVQ